MRCQTARKRISDDLDGALSPGRRAGLESHLGTCSVCRAYREDLGRIQAGAGLPEAEPAYWASFERRLDARLAAEDAGQARVGAPFAARRRWAWAAAAALVLAGISLWYALPRPDPAATEAWIPYDDILDPIVQAAESSPELAGRIDSEIRAAIEEAAPGQGTEAALIPAADPLFWESLSDDDLRAIVTALEKESGLGGPQ